MFKIHRVEGRPILFLWIVTALSLAMSASLQAEETENFILECPQPYAAVVAQIEALGGTVTQQYKNVGAIAVTVPASHRADVLKIGGLLSLHKDVIVNLPQPLERADIQGSDVKGMISGKAMQKILAVHPEGFLFNDGLTGANVLHNQGITGDGVLVANIDTGTANVSALGGRVIGGETFIPFPDPSATSTANDPHGTQTGTTMAANALFLFPNNSNFVQSLLQHAPASVIFNFDPVHFPGLSIVPMIGTAPLAQIYALKVFDSTGAGAPESRIIASMDRAITLRRNFDNGVPSVPVSGSGSEDDPFVFDSLPIQVVNMSLGGGTLFAGGDLEDRLTQAMLDAGMVLVASAGNDGPAAMTGGSPGTGLGSLTSGAASLTPNERVLRDLLFGLGVGSIYRPADHQQMSFFSSRGPTADGRLDPDNSASGFADFAQNADGSLSVVSGTSFSAPNTTGGAAMLREAAPGASARAIRDALINSANPSIIKGAADIDQGRGFVDFPAALADLLDGDDGDDENDDEENDNNTPSASVEKNIARLGFNTIHVNGETVTKSVKNLTAGQVAHFFVRANKDTDRLTFTLDNIHPELPPAQQNLFFGDDILLQIVDAPTSFADEQTFSFVPSGPATFTVDNPQTGILRVAIMGDWTNAGKISADLIISAERSAPGKKTGKGEVVQGETDVFNIDVPNGTSEAVFELSWRENWGHYPTDDLDLILVDADGNPNFTGATFDSPERVVVANPPAGVWHVFVQGFTVNSFNENNEDDDAAESKWEFRATADGVRLRNE